MRNFYTTPYKKKVAGLTKKNIETIRIKQNLYKFVDYRNYETVSTIYNILVLLHFYFYLYLRGREGLSPPFEKIVFNP